jgi:hypothetical protein
MYRAKIPASWTQLEGAASQMPLSCHRPRNYTTQLQRFLHLRNFQDIKKDYKKVNFSQGCFTMAQGGGLKARLYHNPFSSPLGS